MDPATGWPMLTGELATAALWMLLKASLILASAWLAGTLATRCSAAFRHALWTGALAGILLLPLTSVVGPTITFELPALSVATGARVPTPTPADRGAVAVAQRGGLASPPPAAAADASSPAGANAAIPERWAGVGWAGWLLLVWVAGAVGRLAWLCYQVARVRRLAGGARRTTAGREARLARRLAASLGIRRRVRLLESARVSMPLTWGVRRPTVMLPLAARDWPEERLRVVLLHELAHVGRGDYLTLLLSEVACALYWPSPLAWLARRRVGAEQEHACDDLVLTSGTGPLEYAQHLLEIARAFYGTRSSIGAAVAMAREASLKSRVRAVLDPRASRRPLSARGGRLLLSLTAVATLPVAALRQAEAEPPVAPSRASGPVPAAVSESLPSSMEWLTLPPVDSTVARDSAPEEPAAAYLWLEAEGARLAGRMRSATDELASGGRYISIPGREVGEGAEAHFTFEAEHAGSYTFWGRIQAPSNGANSFFVAVDEGEEIVWDVPGPDRERTSRRWTWSAIAARSDARGAEPMVVELGAGRHTVRVRGREAGAKLDGLFVTTDLAYRPRGLRPVVPPARPVQLWMEVEDGEIASPLHVREGEQASAGRYVEVERGARSTARPPSAGRVSLSLEVEEAGTYTLWGRTRLDQTRSDSFWVRLNGGTWIRWNGIARSRGWRWSLVHDSDRSSEPAQFELRRGTNTVEIAYREDGTRLDRLLLTNDPMIDPEREGGG